MRYHYRGIGLMILLGLLTHSLFSQNAGDFVSFRKNATDLRISGTKGDLLIQGFSSSIFKVQWLSTNENSVDTSASVILKPESFTYSVVESATALEISSTECSIEITKKPLSVSLKSNGRTKIQQYNFRTVPDSVYLDFKINPADVFHGSGGRISEVDLNRKVLEFKNAYRPSYFEDIYGYTTQLSQSFNVPFIVSSHQYGLLLDSNLPGNMRMYIGALDSTQIHVEAQSQGKWAYYFINGGSNDEILEHYTLLTGRQPLVPRWALGYLQSKFGYKTEAEAKEVVNKLQAQGFPIDALILDLYWYGDGTTMGNFDWNSAAFPNPTQMMKDWAAKGVKTILISDPYITTKSKNFRLADSLSYLTKNTNNQTATVDMWNGTVGLLDVFKSQTQQWLWAQYKRLTSQGVSGWWCDKIEPEEHPSNFVHVNGSAPQVHNLYALTWAQNLHENHRRDFPEQRVFNLIRSGWAGSQRYGALPWSGDVMRYWAGLKLQIPMMIHSGFSGLAYMHSDIGGFETGPDKREKDEEMDMRWFQFGTFSPIMRAHGQRSSTEPYNLSQPFYDIVKRHIKLRYELLPYIYSLAYQNTTTGRPLCLSMDYFELTNTNKNITDQYFFGENLLVAPILLHGMLVRKVVLPKGKWFNFWTNQLHNGDANLFEKVTNENIPVYAKAGSFIPLASSAKSSTDSYISDSLTVKFFQDVSVRNSSFTMFHDDGKNPNSLKDNQIELIDFLGKTVTDTVQVQIRRRQKFDKSLTTRAITLELENITSFPKAVILNGQTIPVVFQENLFNKDNQAFYNTISAQLLVRFSWECDSPAQITVIRDGLSVLTSVEPTEDWKIYPNPMSQGQKAILDFVVNTSAEYELELVNTAGIVVNRLRLGPLQKDTHVVYPLDVPTLKGTVVLRLKNNLGQATSKKLVIE